MRPQAVRNRHLITELRDYRPWDYQPRRIGLPPRVGWRERIKQALIIGGFCGSLLLSLAVAFGAMLLCVKILAAVVRALGGHF